MNRYHFSDAFYFQSQYNVTLSREISLVFTKKGAMCGKLLKLCVKTSKFHFSVIIDF